MMTPALHCAAMLMSVSLRRVTFALQEAEKKESEETDSKEDQKTIEIEVQSMYM